VVRNSLLLIDFIIDYRAQGHDVKTAVLEAGAVRTRPILLTALAVIVATSIMISDPVFGGLGISMAFGTLASPDFLIRGNRKRRLSVSTVFDDSVSSNVAAPSCANRLVIVKERRNHHDH